MDEALKVSEAGEWGRLAGLYVSRAYQWSHGIAAVTNEIWHICPSRG